MSPSLDGVPLLLKEQVYSLGVFSDPGLLLDKHIAIVVRSAFYQIQLVSQLRPFLGREDLETDACPGYI